MHLELPFRIDLWDTAADEPTGELQATATARVVMRKTYHGEQLTATAEGHALTAQGPRGASYVAQERIIGTLLGRAGSFVLEHGASMGEGYDTVMRAFIVPGSGTGELAGIRGSGTVAHELLTIDLELPTAG